MTHESMSPGICKYCGCGLVWAKQAGKWTPLEGGSGLYHRCPDYEAKKPSPVVTRKASPEELTRFRK